MPLIRYILLRIPFSLAFIKIFSAFNFDSKYWFVNPLSVISSYSVKIVFSFSKFAPYIIPIVDIWWISFNFLLSAKSIIFLTILTLVVSKSKFLPICFTNAAEFIMASISSASSLYTLSAKPNLSSFKSPTITFMRWILFL